ncbi:MAG TPA: heme exporter protein CcmB [Alphaproteobacteria bacterium]|nr:heme exporter protein CcmB [Alphaproteobacteria bacterium]
MSPVLALMRRDVRLALRTPSDSATVVLFFILACVLFPLGIGPEPNILARVATGVIWVMALLASLLSFERLFQLDAEDGSLDLIALAPAPLEFLVLGKCAAHWLITGLPLLLVSPLLGILLNLPTEAYGTLLAALALGTPIVSLIGAIGAALTLGARRGGVLLPLLILPLYVPVLIFGVAAVEASVAGLSPRPHLLLLGGILALSLPLGPFAGAAAVRQALE